MSFSSEHKIDLADILCHYGVVTQGRKALCPFHPDRKPSMSLNLAKGLWYCFTCAKGGDSVKLVQDMDGCDVKEAIQTIRIILNLPTSTRCHTDSYNRREALAENYEILRQILTDEYDKVCERGIFLDWVTMVVGRNVATGPVLSATDHSFLYTYHDKCDRIEQKLRELDHAKYAHRQTAK